MKLKHTLLVAASALALSLAATPAEAGKFSGAVKGLRASSIAAKGNESAAPALVVLAIVGGGLLGHLFRDTSHLKDDSTPVPKDEKFMFDRNISL